MKSFLRMFLFVFPAIGYAQELPWGNNIVKNSNGEVSSIEFSDSGLRPDSPASFFQQALNVSSQEEFRLVPSKQKEVHTTHEHYDQYYSGIRVEGAGYNFHYSDKKMNFAHGHYVKIRDLNTKPVIALDDARDLFAKYLEIPATDIADFKGELIIKEIEDSGSENQTASPKLVYKIFLVSSHPNSRVIGFIDAETGAILTTESDMIHVSATGTFATRYSGSRTATTETTTGGYKLQDVTRGSGIHTFDLNNLTSFAGASDLVDGNNTWTAAEYSASRDDAGLDVHWSLQKIYDHLNNSHGVNSYDDNGVGIFAYYQYGFTTTDKDDAFYSLSEDRLYFGDGGTKYRPLASVDVVGHEFGHGITDFQIGWASTGITASFHEGLSDIWGAIFEYRIKGSSTTNWKIGEQLDLSYTSIRNIQNTEDANARVKIADTYLGSKYNSSSDIYNRSGVFSHWFYVLVNGESGVNDLGNSYSVGGIGMDKAEHLIVYSIINNYLDNTTSYPDIRTATINAAKAIYCDNSIEVAQVTRAWYAVGVGANYSGTFPSITGNEPICTSQSFSVQNQISGTSRLWSSGNTGQMTVSPTTNASTTATRVGSYNGAVNLNLTLTGSGGCSTTITRPVQVGAFTGSQVTVSGQAAVCPGNVYVYTAVMPGGHKSGYTYQWVKPSSWTVNAQSQNTISYYVPINNPNYGAVQVSVHNGCGSSPYSGITAFPGCGGFLFSVYPNPSNTDLNIEAVEDGTAESAKKTKEIEFEVILMTEHGEKITTAKSRNGKATMRTDKYPKGLYVIHITTGNEVIAERVLIE